MSGVGLDWYKRQPAAYLKDTQGLTVKEHAVYAVVLDLIYSHGGTVNNDPKWISGWFSDMGAAAVRGAISSLVDRGILIVDGDQLTQKRAKNEAKTKENQRKKSQDSGRIGGERSAELRANAKESNDLTQATASNEVQPEKRREENIDEIGKPISCPFSSFWAVWPVKKSKAQAEKNWAKLSPQDRFYARDNAAQWFERWRRDNPQANAIHAGSYLSGKRWTDEFDTRTGPTNGKPTNSRDGEGAAMAQRAADRFTARFMDQRTGPDPSQPLLSTGQSSGSGGGRD